MAQFTANPVRFDPYKNFKFRVKWDGKYVAGISKVGMLKRTTEVVKHRDGGDPSSSRKSPGRTEFDAITLERGVTHDIEFEQWANKVWNVNSNVEVSLKDFRKDIIIEVYNESGQKVLGYNVFRCWVSEYQALPDLDANANAIAIQHIKLENEGWQRDGSVTEPGRAKLPRTTSIKRTVMQTLSEQAILHIWEHGLGQHSVEQALTMLSVAFPDVPRNELLALSVGQRDAHLLALREATFGSQCTAFAQCQQCQEHLEFTFDTADVRVGAASPEAAAQVQHLRVEDYEVHVRLPNSADLLAISTCRSIALARDILIQRCVLQTFLHGEEIARESLSETVFAAIGAQMVECDPQSEVDIALSCPVCGQHWSIMFDIVAFLWVELQAYAKRLLRDIHTLATACGWREADILAMSAVRRQFYLEMVS